MSLLYPAAPAIGDTSDQANYRWRWDGVAWLPGVFSILRSLFAATANQTVGNSVTETTVFGAGTGVLVIPANSLQVGSTIRFKVYGLIAAAGAPTIALRGKLAGANITVIAAAPVPNGATQLCDIECQITIRSIGVGGTALGEITYACKDALGALTGTRSATAAAVAVDTTAAVAVDLTLQWTVAAAGNTVTFYNAVVEVF